MAQKKAGGSTKNLQDSKPKYLGLKVTPGQTVQPGSILMRQRGTRMEPGRNVGMGKDHTLYAEASGVLKVSTRRKTRFDNTTTTKKVLNVNEEAAS